MTRARLHTVAAGPLVTMQDGGRFGHLRHGIPASGPMDRTSHAVANAVLDNSLDATAIEVSRGGATFECRDTATTVAVVSPGFRVAINAAPAESSAVITLRPGDRLSIASGASGSWAYLAVAGQIEATAWLGHTATHAPSGLGGGSLPKGSDVVIDVARADSLLDGPVAFFDHRLARDADSGVSVVRVVPGPQDHRFTATAIERFVSEPFALTEAFDRMGVRLDGPRLDLDEALSIPSEPIVRGSVQVAGDGAATVLLADHQTTGGYPKIATVVGADLGAFSQLRPGDRVRFEMVTPVEATDLARAQHARFHTFVTTELLRERHLTQRLVDTDLIGGIDTE